MSQRFTDLDDEFALVEQTAAEAGLRQRHAAPGPPELGQRSRGRPRERGLLGRRASGAGVPARGGRERARLGHRGPGRGPHLGGHRPARPRAVRLAPRRAVRARQDRACGGRGHPLRSRRARIVVGTGLGGRTAVALHRRHPQLLARLALVDTLPGAGWERAQDCTDPKTPESPERFASREEAFAVLASRRPERSSRALRRRFFMSWSRTRTVHGGGGIIRATCPAAGHRAR